MNLILFDSADEAAVIEKTDPRAMHIQQVLKLGEGDQLFVGVVDGPRGKATIVAAAPHKAIHLSIDWDTEPLQPLPISLLVGLPRPQTARKILQECTALGVARIIFFQSDKGEPSYRESKLWQNDAWRRQLFAGAEQAFNTTLPEVIHADSLQHCFDHCNGGAQPRYNWALDIYEAPCSFAERVYATRLAAADASWLAIGSERGWSAAERAVLSQQGFELLHLGERVLRTETACVLAVGMVAGAYGFKSKFLHDSR